jgi:hypothetical protein
MATDSQADRHQFGVASNGVAENRLMHKTDHCSPRTAASHFLATERPKPSD